MIIALIYLVCGVGVLIWLGFLFHRVNLKLKYDRRKLKESKARLRESEEALREYELKTLNRF